MYTSVKGDGAFFLACVLVGIIAAFLYDIIRISRRIVKANALVICGEDIVFLVVSALLLFYAAYVKNSGEIRWQGFIGGATGVLGYFLIFKNNVVNIGTAVVIWGIKAALWVLRVVMFPVRIVLRALKKPVAFVAWYTSRHISRAKRVAKCSVTRMKMRISAARAMAKKK